MGGLDHGELGVAGPVIGEPEYLVAHRESVDPLAKLLDHAGEIAALS